MLNVVPENQALAISCTDVGIRYRQYREKIVTFKDAFVRLFRGSQYEDFWALRGLNLHIHQGECIGVIGKNGSGKSTLMKTIAGVLPPTEGSLTTHGRITPLIELGAGFNSELTGRENIFLNGAIMGFSRKEMEAKLQDIVAFSELEDFIDIPLRNYSSGMRTRLGFAVASDVDPDILLLDEIFAVGDEGFREKCTERMNGFFEQNKTIIMASHNLTMISEYCNRALYLRQGELRADGSPDEVIAQYRADVAEAKTLRSVSQ